MNNILKELCRGVCYYINDPKTWVNFALTCRYFASLCREYTPMKKNEFRITIRVWMRKFTDKEPRYIHIFLPLHFDIPLVLPNGMLHGSYKSGVDGNNDDDDGYIFTVNTGKILSAYNCKHYFSFMMIRSEKHVNTLRFIKHIIVLSGNSQLQYCNLHLNHYVHATKCFFCKKYHTFLLSSSGICYHRNCLETTYKITRINMMIQWRRLQIARSIIEYAKKKINDE